VHPGVVSAQKYVPVVPRGGGPVHFAASGQQMRKEREIEEEPKPSTRKKRCATIGGQFFVSITIFQFGKYAIPLPFYVMSYVNNEFTSVFLVWTVQSY
jgi:hypothetical protein